MGGHRGILIIRDDGSLPYAYVEVETRNDVVQALKMHKRHLGSRLVEGEAGGCDWV